MGRGSCCTMISRIWFSFLFVVLIEERSRRPATQGSLALKGAVELSNTVIIDGKCIKLTTSASVFQYLVVCRKVHVIN